MASTFLLFFILSTPFLLSPLYTAASRIPITQAPSSPMHLSPSPSPLPSPPPTLAIKAGYWPAWNNPTFPPSAIDLSYFTHVLYAFTQPSPLNFELIITSDDEPLLANFTATLHTHWPPVKALLSIGGGGSSRATFADLVSTPSNRFAFISSSIAVARGYNLDGLDLDWEFPANPEEMTNLGHLFSEWGTAIEQESMATGRPRLLLTSAVYFASNFFLDKVHRSYPVTAMACGLDWVNAMCFDYHGGWNTSETGLHAALYDPRSNVSSNYGIRSWLAAGMPAEKVVMGIPLYGRTWRLKDAGDHQVGAAAVGVGPGNKEGIIVYSAVVKYNMMNNATVVDDETMGSTYSYVGTSWIGYEDLTSVARKIEFAQGLGLRGYFLWALGYDYNWSISRKASITWEG